MWRQYRRLLVPTQLFILTCCVTIYVTSGRDWRPAVAVLVVMQLGSLAAAARAAKPRTAPRKADDRLPLQRHD